MHHFLINVLYYLIPIIVKASTKTCFLLPYSSAFVVRRLGYPNNLQLIILKNI